MSEVQPYKIPGVSPEDAERAVGLAFRANDSLDMANEMRDFEEKYGETNTDSPASEVHMKNNHHFVQKAGELIGRDVLDSAEGTSDVADAPDNPEQSEVSEELTVARAKLLEALGAAYKSNPTRITAAKMLTEADEFIGIYSRQEAHSLTDADNTKLAELGGIINGSEDHSNDRSLGTGVLGMAHMSEENIRENQEAQWGGIAYWVHRGSGDTDAFVAATAEIPQL